MGIQDQFGVTHSSGDQAAIRELDGAVSTLLILRNDSDVRAARAAQIDPGLIGAHVLRGLVNILGTDSSQLPAAREALAAGRAVAAGSLGRERAHLAALEAWISGRLFDACAIWEQILIDEPRDALAMYAAHQGDFFLGQSTELRDRVARRLPGLDTSSKLAGYYRGMYAFGLEETGQYARAEEQGVSAVDSDPRDAWAVHAVAHVLEMTNRVKEGESWLLDRTEDWDTDNFFAIHNWWHLALYYLDQRQFQEVLSLYDIRIRRNESHAILDLLDATALLWRLQLLGVELGRRWEPLVNAWAERIEDRWYAFNDYHAALTFAGAGRIDLLERLLAVLAHTAQQSGDNATMTRFVALPVAQAARDFVVGRYTAAVDRLLPIRAQSARAGGSNAQRDLLGLTLLVAAERAQERSLFRALVNERSMQRPASGINRHWQQQLLS